MSKVTAHLDRVKAKIAKAQGGRAGGIYEEMEKALEKQQTWQPDHPGEMPWTRFKHNPDLDVYWDSNEYRINEACKRLEALEDG